MAQGIKPKYDLELINRLILKGKSLKELAKLYNIHSSSMGRFLKKQNILYNLQVRKIDKNHFFFSDIDSEIKAYLLGFFVADGCVYDKSRIGICIKKSDSYIIELFRNYIAPDSYVREMHNTKGAINRQPQLLLRISSEQIVKDLKKYGIGPRKTYSPIKLPNISKKYINHFIRGYFDGDGSIRRRNPNHMILEITFTNGDKTILEEIQKYYNCGKLTFHTTYYRLSFYNTKEVLSICKKMYENSNFYFSRKKNIYDSVNTEVISKSKILETP